MSSLLDLLIVVAANVLGAVMSTPQAARLVRTGRVDGVSPSWAAMSLVLNVWWVAYGLGARSWAMVPVAFLSVIGYTIIIGGLAVHGEPGARPGSLAIRLGLAAGALPAIGLLVGGWPAVGVLLGSACAAQLAPAVVASIRADDLAGVSLVTWLVAWAEALLWGAHGLRHGDVALIVLAIAGVGLSSVVLMRLFGSRASTAPVELCAQADSRFA